MKNKVAPDEELTRYIFSDRYFSKEKNIVKYVAFMPAPSGKTSVFCTSSLSEDKIWNIADTKVVPLRRQPIKARADILANHVFAENLQILLDNSPPRHANIIGWPDEKSKKISIALELAKKADLFLK